MVLKTATCRFSGLRIYPGKGIIFVRIDGQQFLFLNKKARRLYHQRKRPAKIAWTTVYRKQHRKDLDTVVARKKRRSVNKTNVRPIGNATIEVLQKRRAEKPEQRKASREAALREVKERMKKTKAEKATQKSAQPKGTSRGATKVMPKGGAKGGKR